MTSVYSDLVDYSSGSSPSLRSSQLSTNTSSQYQSQSIGSSNEVFVSGEDTFIFPKMILAKVLQQAQNHPLQRNRIARKLKPHVHKVFQGQLEDLAEREKRCNTSISEMERLLCFMKREKEDLLLEKSRVEALLTEQQNSEDAFDANSLTDSTDSVFMSDNQTASSPESALEEIAV
jgi:hypothetical protein